jgi:hypothetical protein
MRFCRQIITAACSLAIEKASMAGVLTDCRKPPSSQGKRGIRIY